MNSTRISFRQLWISGGVNDPLLPKNQQLTADLKEKGFPLTAVETPGTHDWTAWHYSLIHFAPLLFQSAVNPRDGLSYQWIPPGSYYTGCLPGDPNCYGLERKRKEITITQGFWIGRTEVTQAAYMRVMNANPSPYKGPDSPVDSVGWNDATTYCSRVGLRLPTESEWEWAAYGGTPALLKEPLGDYTWYDSNSNDSTHPVATKLPNRYGLLDTLGNVWEWVQDAGRGPGEHILKGGSFYNTPRDVRVSGRMSAPSDLRHRDLGFRCAASSWPDEISPTGSTTLP